MNLYLISQTVNNGYNTYDSAVVCAPDEETARRIHPTKCQELWEDEDSRTWAPTPEDVRVKLLGVAALDIEPGVVCASFNAG